MRRDGSSRFGSNYKFGDFPAFSAAWRISDESFFRPLTRAVSDLKFRYSWGISGNDRIGTNDYPSVSQVNPTSYSFAGTQAVGYSVTTISSPDLRWEKTTSSNIGLDASLLNNRITLAVDYYSKVTKDLLLAAPVALATGFTVENKNVGSVKNEGIEFNITSANITHKDFKWSTRANLSFNKNEVLALTNNNTPITIGFGSTVQIAVGQPIYAYKVYKAIGVYTTTSMLNKLPRMSSNIIGDPIYQDMNNDGKIDANDITNMGSPTPTRFWGMTNNFSYRQFDLSILLQGSSGNQIFSLFGRNIDRPTTGLGNYNAREVWAHRFRSVDQPGDGVTPRIDATTAGLYDSRWIYDGAFWKIKNITAGYNLPSNIVKGIASIRIYVSADNVWMHDNYTGGYSPEAFQNDANLADYSSYPTARTFSAGINIGL
jgi:TonB-linked SusC/RagA family outer membrane protein